MSRPRRSFDREFRDGAVRIVRETGQSVAQVARDLGVNKGTLGNWVRRDAAERAGGLSVDERAELVPLRKVIATLRMERDVLKRSVVGWVNGLFAFQVGVRVSSRAELGRSPLQALTAPPPSWRCDPGAFSGLSPVCPESRTALAV